MTLLLLPLVLYFSLLFHEIGHAVLGRWAGLRVTAVGMGLGKPFIVWRFGTVTVYLAAENALQGLAFMFPPTLVASRTQLVLFLLGGVIANLLLAAITLSVWAWLPFGVEATVCLLAAAFNAWLGFGNLLPLRVQIGSSTLRSDGASVFYVLRVGQLPVAPVNTILFVETLRGLLCAVGDRLSHTIHLIGAASAWQSLGCAARAEVLAAEAAANADITPEVSGLYALCRAGLAILAGRTAEADEHLKRAEALFTSHRIDAGLLFTTMGRAECCLSRGDTRAAIALLESLRANTLLRLPALRADWLVLCVAAHAASGDDATLDRLRSEWKALSRIVPSVERDLTIKRTLAARAAARGEHASAEIDFRQALDAAKQVFDRLPSDADRSDFVLGQQVLLFEPARACLVLLGKAEEAEQLAIPFRTSAPTPTEIEGAEALLHRRRRKNRLFLKLGLLVGVLDGVAAALLFPIASEHDAGAPISPLRELAAITFVILFLGALTTVPVAGGWYLAGLHVPSLHDRNGWFVLVLALVPWVVAIVVGLRQLASF